MRALALVLLFAACGGARTITSAPVAPRDPCAGRATAAIDVGDTCLAAGADAWAVRLENLTEVDCENDCDGVRATVGAYRIAYERADGSRAVTDPIELRNEPGDHISVSFLGAYDYDGDGAAELVVRVERTYYEGGDAWTNVLTAPPGSDAVHHLAAAQTFAESIDAVNDADGDGRPDLIAHAPWRTGGWSYTEGGGGFAGGPRTLFHSLADGTFVTGDAVGRAFWQSECPAQSALVPPMTDPDDEDTYANADVAVSNVTCAALTGTAGEISTRLEREWSAHPCTYDAQACEALHERLRARIAAVTAP